VRPPGGDDEQGVGALDVGPAGGQRAHLRLSGPAVEDALLAPGVGVADELELLAAQGMEGMGDGEAPRAFSTICS
jgi:hypothetical protein